MNGYMGFTHDCYQTDLEDEGLKNSYEVFREFEAGKLGWVDLLFLQNSHRIAVEVEMRSRLHRIALNIEKAKSEEVCATELWLICPHRNVINSINLVLAKLENDQESLPIYLLLKHQAIKRLNDISTAPWGEERRLVEEDMGRRGD